jgi:uncharacterized DUF497 family protein
VTGLQGKRWYFFIWDEYNLEHLLAHEVTAEEAEELFFNPYVITPNKKKHGPKRYRIDGRTNSGRKLRIIFEDLGKSVARVVTGWDL